MLVTMSLSMQFAATCGWRVVLWMALRRGSSESVLSGGMGDGGGGKGWGEGEGGGDGGGGDGGGGDGDLFAENTSTSARFRTRDAPGSTIVTYHPETPPQSNAKGPYVEGAI